MKTCNLICNLESGKGIKEQDLNKIIEILEKNDYKTILHITKKPKDATEIVENLDYCDLVLSIGGDGTFNEVITGNYNRKDKLILSHIPVGTTNDMGYMLGMGKNITKNVKNILNGEIRQIDIGFINDQPFAYVAGFGKFINVPYATSRKLKKTFGYFAYLINGIKEFYQTTKLYELEYTIDGLKHKGLYSLILVSNANHIAGFNNIYKNVKLDDSKLEVVFCNMTERKDLVKTLLILMREGITEVPGLYCYTANEIDIKFKDNPKLHWTIDGEKNKDEVKEYKIKIDKETKMLLPRKNLDKLFTKKE